MVSAFGVLKGVVTVAIAISVSVFILMLPGFLLFLIDRVFGSNLYDLWLPVMALAIQLSYIAYIPLAVTVDFVVNSGIDVLNWILGFFGGRINYRLTLRYYTYQVRDAILNAIVLIGAGKTTSYFTRTGGSGVRLEFVR